MINTPSPPPPPDPAATAAAQSQSNKETAIAQTRLNATNQRTPYGNLTYTQGPKDESGVPQWTAEQTLSPGEQKIYDLGLATRGNIGQIGVDQSQRIGNLLGTPVDLSPQAVGGYLTDLGMKRLQPQLDRTWQARETDLMNRGVMPGGEAYTREQDAFNRQKNDAYNQLVLGGQQQGVANILAQRNQPINEITALMSGSQVSNPAYTNTPQTSVAPTDVANIYNNAYQGQLAAYGMQQQGQNALLGGLAGLGGAALGGWGMGGFKKFW